MYITGQTKSKKYIKDRQFRMKNIKNNDTFLGQNTGKMIIHARELMDIHKGFANNMG